MPTPGPGFNVDPQGNAAPGSPATGAYRKKNEGIAQPYDWAGGGPTKEPTATPTAKPATPATPLNRRQRLSRNLSSNQFSQHPVMKSLGRSFDVYETSRAFRHSGLMPAMRYAIGAPQTSYHLKDLLGGQALRHIAGDGGNAGNPEHPGPITPEIIPPGEM